MRCPRCNALIENGSAFCGTCGLPIASQPAQDLKTVSDKTAIQLDDKPPPAYSRYDDSVRSQGTFLQTPPDVSVFSPPRQRDITPPVSRPTSTNLRRNILIGVLLLLLIAGGTIGALLVLKNNTSLGTGAAKGTTVAGGTTSAKGVAGASGQVAFLDNANGSPGHTDALKIAISGLSTPPSGSQYQAWLIDDKSEQVLSLGTLAPESGQKFSLNYTGNKQNLLGLGNKLEITLETGQVNLPTGKVVLSGTFPPKAFVHIRHLLVSFPTTPGQIGLLVGLRSQAQLLNAQALVLQNIAASGDQTAIQCAAQSIIDISEGKNGSHYQPLAANCASHNITQTGDGFGILGQNDGYVAMAAAHASLAATQSDSTDTIRVHAGHVEIATTNIKGWVTTVDQDALKLLNGSSSHSVIQEIVNLSDHAFHGVDIDGDEQVDPVPGEAGAITAYIHGQLMAGLPLVAGA